MICPKCGTENGTRNVCSKCGNFLNNKNTQRVTDPVMIKKMKSDRRKAITKGCLSSTLLTAVVLIVGTILLVLVTYFFVNVVFKDGLITEDPNATTTTVLETTSENPTGSDSSITDPTTPTTP